MAYNNKKDSAIETIGAIGVGISIFCLIQFMIYLKRAETVTFLLILGNICSIAAYVLFFRINSIYIYVLGVAALLTLFCTTLLSIIGVISALQIILVLLNIVVLLMSFELKFLTYIKEVEAYKKTEY